MSKNKTHPKQLKNKNVSVSQFSKTDKIYTIGIFIALCALIFYPPYVRGLYFNEDFFLYYILTAIVFILILIDKISRRDFEFLSTPLDWAVAAYAGAYLLSLIGAVQPGEAVYGFLKVLNYFIVYWMVSQMVRTYKAYERLLQVLLASGVGVALIGILAATGYSKYPSAFDGKIITATLQYKNATAVFLVVLTILGTTLWAKDNKKLIRPLYSLANYLMILVILGTMSKGGWLALALGAVVLVIGMPGQYRIRAIYVLAMSGFAAVITAIKFLPAVTGGNAAHALPYLLLGLAVLFGGELLWNFILFSRRRWGRTAIIGGVVLLLIVFAASGYFNMAKIMVLQQKVQSGSIVSQAQNIGNTSDFSYTSRLDIYRWGLAIVKDHPFFGTGAGGWNALYHKYQDYLFYTTEAHNHYLQVLIEAGVLGLLAFLSIWWMLILSIGRQRRRLLKESTEEKSALNREHWILNWSVATAALTLGVHAFIDFDLSLGALCIVLWTLFALINAGTRIEQIFPAKKTNIWAFLAIGLILFIIPLVSGQHMLAANNLYQKANALFNQTLNMPAGAEKDTYLQNIAAMATAASQTDPYNGSYPALLAQTSALQYQALSQQQKANGAEKIQIIKKAMQSAQESSPNDIKVRNALLNTCIYLQDTPGAIKQAAFLTEISPLDANTYSAVINIAVGAADSSFKRKDNNTAREYLQTSIEYAKKMESQEAKIDHRKTKAPFWAGASFVLDPEARLNLAKADFYLGDYLQARQMLTALMQEQADFKVKAEPWYLAAMFKMGEAAGTRADVESLRTADPQGASTYDQLCGTAPLTKQ